MTCNKSYIFLDLFTIRQYDTIDDLCDVINIKANGQRQPKEYVENIVSTIKTAAFSNNETSSLCPFWHFNTRKAIEMWPKEVYRKNELFPLVKTLKFGPLTNVYGLEPLPNCSPSTSGCWPVGVSERCLPVRATPKVWPQSDGLT